MPKTTNYSLTLNLEKDDGNPDLAQIIECIELGTFESEDDARACMNLILESAEMEAVEDDGEDEN